jgi:hypothetical protein
MPARVFGDLRNHLEAELPIKLGCLKTVRCEYELLAAASYGLCLGLGYQATAKATAAERRGHPDLAQLARFSPRVACGPCHDVLQFVSQKHAETPTVPDACCARIELVESVLEKLDVGGRRFLDLEATQPGFHRRPDGPTVDGKPGREADESSD